MDLAGVLFLGNGIMIDLSDYLLNAPVENKDYFLDKRVVGMESDNILVRYKSKQTLLKYPVSYS